jgi:predicted transcriptional regulator
MGQGYGPYKDVVDKYTEKVKKDADKIVAWAEKEEKKEKRKIAKDNYKAGGLKRKKLHTKRREYLKDVDDGKKHMDLPLELVVDLLCGDTTQQEVADFLGKTQPWVSQCLKRYKKIYGEEALKEKLETKKPILELYKKHIGNVYAEINMRANAAILKKDFDDEEINDLNNLSDKSLKSLRLIEGESTDNIEITKVLKEIERDQDEVAKLRAEIENAEMIDYEDVTPKEIDETNKG